MVHFWNLILLLEEAFESNCQFNRLPYSVKNHDEKGRSGEYEEPECRSADVL
jgi:hypothetical protein